MYEEIFKLIKEKKTVEIAGHDYFITGVNLYGRITLAPSQEIAEKIHTIEKNCEEGIALATSILGRYEIW